MSYKREYLNENLIFEQNLTDEDVTALCQMHDNRIGVFDEMERLDPSDPVQLECLRENAAMLTKIEFKLQELWKFPQDSNFHSWWFHVPHCTCPVMDNMDCIGTKFNIMNAACVVHGR